MLELSGPERQIPLTPTKKLGNLEFSGYLKSHLETAHLIFSIEKYLQHHHSFYLNSILSELKGLSLQLIKEKLEKQYNALLESKSFFHIMNNGIEARKKCLNKIRRDITKISKFLTLFPQQYFGQTQADEVFIDWVEGEGYTVVDVDQSVDESIRAISNILADMNRLREMTIYLVEQIHQWKVRIEEHLDRCQQHSEIKYIYDNQSIYQVILNDSNFIWSSKLNQYIWMQAKQDPFIIRNVIMVEQRSTKTLLQKYFLELVYPQNQQIVDKAVRCFEMLAFKYRPKVYNRFEEEELLIQNYLKMQMDHHQFDEPEEGIKIASSPQLKDKQESPKEEGKAKGNSRLNVRGWVFEKQLKKPNRERINDIIETHKQKMGIIKPFNIANYLQKNSIALAYLSDVNYNNQKDRKKKKKKLSFNSQKEDRNVQSEGQGQKVSFSNDRGLQSEPQRKVIRGMSESKMYRSTAKLSPIIYEDPKQHLPDTPKAKIEGNSSQAFKYFSQTANVKTATLQHAKINSFANNLNSQTANIEIEQEETPLNLSKFYTVFRADTNKPIRINDNLQSSRKKEANKDAQNEKLAKIKTFLQKIRKQRTQRAKSMQHLPYQRKTVRISLSKRKDKSKEKSLEKSGDSYPEYSKITSQQKLQLSKDSNQLKKIFLGLKAKSIPRDLVEAYLKYLQNKRPDKSRIFTEFNTKVIANKLTDPFLHSIIFDIIADSNTSVGTIILSETLGGRAGRLKYFMEYMFVQPFELVSVAMLRVAQELLSATPCQQVVYPLIVDRLDLVSSHFIDIIDSDLTKGVQKFGRLVILEKPKPSLKGTDIRERMYAFSSVSNSQKQHGLKLKMMGNYRSLKFNCKCLVLTSNFRLRSDNLFKETLHKYHTVALGELFAKVLLRVMTKYHLKQLKQASFGNQGELGDLIRSDPFVRSVLHATVSDMKGTPEDLLKTTVFSNMDDLLNYLRYKNHDEHFQFQFLAESRFILQHQLILIQLDEELSLQFTLTSNQQIYILHNNKQHQILQIKNSQFDTSAFLLPTTHDKIDLFIMPAVHYLEDTTDKVDLYSYLFHFFRNIQSEIYLNQVPSLVMPNLHKEGRKASRVRMFDGFFKLFPEREFYSAALIECVNHWQAYYADAVIHQPGQNSIVFQFPFIMGFYDKHHKVLLSAFLYSKEENSSSSQ